MYLQSFTRRIQASVLDARLMIARGLDDRTPDDFDHLLHPTNSPRHTQLIRGLGLS